MPASFLVATVAIVVLVSGCASAQRSGRSTSAGVGAAAVAGPAGPAASAGGSRPAGAAGVLATSPADRTQQIAYTAEIRLRVRNVGQAAIDVRKLTKDAGGFVFSQTATYQASPQASLSLRVPPGQSQPVLGKLAAVGVVLDQNVKADDGSQQVTTSRGASRQGRPAPTASEP